MTHIVEKAWALQHRLEAWYARPRSRREKAPSKYTVNPEWAMAIGVAWALLGLWLWEYYWILGGFLFFIMGLFSLHDD